MKRLALIIFLGIVIMMFLTSAHFASAQEKEKKITVGLSLILTGPQAPSGSAGSNGILDHLMRINDQGGIEYKEPRTGKSDRIKMEIIWEDNAWNPSKSLSIYKRFKAEGAQVILILGSGPGEAISPSLSQDKIPGLAMYAYASPRGYSPKPPYYMASIPTCIEDFCTIVKWFMSTWKESRSPKIGAIMMEVPSWRLIGDPEGGKAEVEKVGGVWLGMEWVPMMPTDLSVQITRLMNKGADLIVVAGGINHTIVAAKDMSRLGIDLKKVKVVANASSWDETLIRAIPKEGEGIYGSSFTVFPSEDVPGVRLAKEIAQWRGRKLEEVNTNYILGFVSGYALKAALKNALEKVGYEKITPTDIRDSLFSLKDVDCGGIVPKLTIKEPDYPTFISHARFSKMEGGQFKVVSDWVGHVKVEYGRR